MIGNNGSGRMDHYFAYGICGLVVLLLSHGLGRIATRRRMAGIVIEKHYLYTLPVRCWHWLNALAFALLIVSGFALHWVHSSFHFGLISITPQVLRLALFGLDSLL